MPYDPHAQFDRTVLELIERSQVGAVPSTPVYQDALNRLHASHQVYADADHKDGHVTARSLAGSPSFHARNLGELIADQIPIEALEPNAAIFERYVQSLPSSRRERAESFRVSVAGRPVHHRSRHVGTAKVAAVFHDLPHTLFLVPGTGPHPGLPGNYLYGSLLQSTAEAVPNPWSVQLHDCDDGAARFDAPTLPVALAKLTELLESAPFNLNELEAFGFRPL